MFGVTPHRWPHWSGGKEQSQTPLVGPYVLFNYPRQEDTRVDFFVFLLREGHTHIRARAHTRTHTDTDSDTDTNR